MLFSVIILNGIEERIRGFLIISNIFVHCDIIMLHSQQ